MPKTLPLAILGLLMLAPAALANGTDEKPVCPDGQVDTPEGCSQQAWVDDCPPDMMCAMGAPPEGNATEEPAAEEPVQYGPDGCAECSGPISSHASPGDGPATCMDGADDGEVCRDDVLYFGGGPADNGPVRGPEDGSCENCRGDAADEGAPASKDAAGIGITAALGLAALVAAVVRRN